MVDINKLQSLLESSLETETDDSLRSWLNEKRKMQALGFLGRGLKVNNQPTCTISFDQVANNTFIVQPERAYSTGVGETCYINEAA